MDGKVIESFRGQMLLCFFGNLAFSLLSLALIQKWFSQDVWRIWFGVVFCGFCTTVFLIFRASKANSGALVFGESSIFNGPSTVCGNLRVQNIAKLLQKIAEGARKMEAPPPGAAPMFEQKEPAHPAVTSTPTLAPADALDEAATPPPAAMPAASSAPAARRVALAARPKAAASFLAGDLSFVGTLSGAGDVHLGGAFDGEIRARDVTVGVGGRVEGLITGRRVEVLGRVRGGLVADELKVRASAQVDGDVTSESFSLDAGARFEGRSIRKPR